MSSRPGLTRLFPRRWRTRYEQELADLIDDMKTDERGFHLRDRLDLARAGLCERGAELSSRSANRPWRVFAGAGALVVALGCALLIGGVFGGPPLPTRSPLVIAKLPASLVPVSVPPGARMKVGKITSLAAVRPVQRPVRPTAGMRVVRVSSLAPVTSPPMAKVLNAASVASAKLVSVSGSSDRQVTVGAP